MRSRWILTSVAKQIAVASVVLSFVGCEHDHRAAAGDALEFVYICTETEEAFVGAPQATPLANPDTGRKTLVRAVYNPATERWQALPPLALLDGNPGAAISRDADQPLTSDGPREGLRRLDGGESGKP